MEKKKVEVGYYVDSNLQQREKKEWNEKRN